MTFEYRVRRGDIDFDGRSDLFVHRTRGGAAGDGTIDALVLRQLAGGVLAPRAVSAAERLSAAAWPEAGATIALRDVNVDGFVDVILGRVSSALGVSGVPAQIVYAPGAASGITRGIRRVDSAFGRFGRDIVAYVKDAEHFSANAPIRTSTHTYIDYVCNYNYLDPNDWMYSWYNNCYPILVTVYVTYPDYSAFSSDAVDIWTHERSIEQGSISARTGLGRIEAEIEDVLNVDVAEWDVRELIGEALPDADQRHGTELFLAILGIATAHAQEQGAASSPPDVVEVRGRRVMGFGPIHTALRYGPTTVSGYDNDPRALTDGLLVSQVNWPPDRPLLTMPLGTVSGGPPALYWARVLAADANYDDDLRYDALPSIGRGGYNSNGYANGLIRATNGVPSIRMEDFVGGEVPVPASEFN